MVLRRYQPRKNLHATSSDDYVVEAAPKILAPTFYDAQSAALSAIKRRCFVEPNNPMSNTMHRAF